MAFQAVPETASAEIRYDLGGKQIENVLHFKYDGGYSLANLQALADLIDTWVDTDWLPINGNSVAYRETFVRGLTSATDLFAVGDDNTGSIGGYATSNPNNVSKAIKLGTGQTGRNARGRLFVPVVPQGVTVGDNTITQGWADDLIEAIEALIALAEAIGWVLVIVSRYVDGVKRTEGETFKVLTVGVSNLTTDSMRGRMI